MDNDPTSPCLSPSRCVTHGQLRAGEGIYGVKARWTIEGRRAKWEGRHRSISRNRPRFDHIYMRGS